jgi:hypothetical protein
LKTLIIRLDKLGDFYITLPYINAIKRKHGRENIEIVVSESIYEHFKEKKYLFNKIYSYPNKNIFKKILLILNLRSTQFQNVILFDGKDKSIILSLFLKSFKKIFFLEKRKINFYFKLFTFNTKKNEIIINNMVDSYHIHFKIILSILKIDFKSSDFTFLKFEDIKSLNSIKSISHDFNNYTLLHLDEKWFSKLYIKKFIDINPTDLDFFNFIKRILVIKKTNLVITTGIINIDFLDNFVKKNFFQINNNTFQFNFDNHKVFFIQKSNMNELEILTMNSKNLITCNGPLTQVGTSFNINVIDIIEKELENWYTRHISNKKSYNKLFRKDFNKLADEILLKIK